MEKKESNTLGYKCDWDESEMEALAKDFIFSCRTDTGPSSSTWPSIDWRIENAFQGSPILKEYYNIELHEISWMDEKDSRPKMNSSELSKHTTLRKRLFAQVLINRSRWQHYEGLISQENNSEAIRSFQASIQIGHQNCKNWLGAQLEPFIVENKIELTLTPATAAQLFTVSKNIDKIVKELSEAFKDFCKKNWKLPKIQAPTNLGRNILWFDLAKFLLVKSQQSKNVLAQIWSRNPNRTFREIPVITKIDTRNAASLKSSNKNAQALRATADTQRSFDLSRLAKHNQAYREIKKDMERLLKAILNELDNIIDDGLSPQNISKKSLMKDVKVNSLRSWVNPSSIFPYTPPTAIQYFQTLRNFFAKGVLSKYTQESHHATDVSKGVESIIKYIDSYPRLFFLRYQGLGLFSVQQAYLLFNNPPKDISFSNEQEGIFKDFLENIKRILTQCHD